MSFDPTKPANNSPNSSAEMRSQLTGLKALIDAILTITSAQVDGVNSVPPGNPANVSLSVIGNTLHFTFDLPQGRRHHLDDRSLDVRFEAVERQGLVVVPMPTQAVEQDL